MNNNGGCCGIISGMIMIWILWMIGSWVFAVWGMGALILFILLVLSVG